MAKKKNSMVVQTLILSKSKFKSSKDAKKWVKNHGFKSSKIDETSGSYRFRQIDPGRFDKDTFRTITITDGVKAVVGKKKVKRSKIEGQILIRRQFIILERDSKKRIVTGIVADPENVDSYDNSIDEEEIERAAIEYMERYVHTGVNHEKDGEGNPLLYDSIIRVVENWVARNPGNMNGTNYPKGAWLQSHKVLDDGIWERVESKELTGFSFEAFCTRVPIEGALNA
jgi:hypothetical protein